MKLQAERMISVLTRIRYFYEEIGYRANTLTAYKLKLPTMEKFLYKMMEENTI